MKMRWADIRRMATAGAAVLALLLTGCVGDRTGTLFGPEKPLPVEAPRATGIERAVDREHIRLVKAFGGEYRAPQMHALLSEVTGRLVPATERPDESYRVTILDSPIVNAFALPNGRLYVTRGLLALANDTSEIAAVLAHEIAHVTLRHAAARNELELRSALLSRVAAEMLGDPLAGEMVRHEARYTIASFSRTQELEADQIGVRTLAQAGYDPYGAARFLNSLGRSVALKASSLGEHVRGNSPDMLSTHPGTSDRIILALQAARRIAAPGIGGSDRARYLAALDGISFGDDPADGVIRGRRFIHARLGVAFEGPEGFSLENTPRAVVGASADGSRRLLFDAVDGRDGQSLDDLLRSTWNDAIETDSIETLTVNGLPAAIATSRGRDWAFRLAAVQAGEMTYRLIVAGRTLNGDLERVFRRTLDSIRPITPEEARSTRPLRLQVITAGPEDTLERLAQSMPVPDRAVERFIVLNGLERGAAVKPGERYKIIVE